MNSRLALLAHVHHIDIVHVLYNRIFVLYLFGVSSVHIAASFVTAKIGGLNRLPRKLEHM